MNSYTVDKEGNIIISLLVYIWSYGKLESCPNLVYMDRIQRNIATAVSTAELEERFNPEYIRTKGIGEGILPITEEDIIIKASLIIHHLIRGGC